MLGGIGAWFALSGEDDGPDVAVDPEPSVTTAPQIEPEAVQFEFRWIEPEGVPEPEWSTWTRDERGSELIVHPSGALRYEVPGEGVGYSPPGVEINPLSGPSDDYDRIDDDARWVGHLWLDGAEAVTETAGMGRDLLAAEVESYREGDLRVELVVDAVTWMPVEAIYSDGVRFETRGFDDTVSSEAIALPDPSTHSPEDPWLTWPESPPAPVDGPDPNFRLTWIPPGFTESENGRALEAPWRTVEIDDGRGREDMPEAPRETYEPAGVLVGGIFDGETVFRTMPITFGPRASVLMVDGRVTVAGDVPFGDMVRILEGMEDVDPTEVRPEPEDAAQSVTATVERVSEVGVSGTFTLVADRDGTVILKSADADFGYHASSGATWRIEGGTSVNEIDPINGRRGLESLLMLDLAESVRYGGLGAAADRDGRSS